MGDAASMMELARSAAITGGTVILDAGGNRESTDKGLPGDYVTQVDLTSERAIARHLQDAAPTIPVLGEELGGIPDAPRTWVVDPLDGTTNFVHGFPAVGVSVALVQEGRPIAGCVHAPFLGETYLAGEGLGAWRESADGTRVGLRVSERPPERAVVGTGFPFRRKEKLPRYLAAFAAALEAFEDLRRPGAASMDLAWVAAGVFDGFFELALAPWDVAAGGLLVEEAGGMVTDWSGGNGWLQGDILAGPPAVLAELVRLERGPADVP